MVHFTRFEAPGFLAVNKKEYKWVVRPSPGPHRARFSVPLAVVLRDQLKVATSIKEVKAIVSQGKVLVDGRIRKDYRYPIGVMDVIAIPSASLYFRAMPHPTDYITLVKITSEDATYKLVKVANKTTLTGKRTQLNLDDGRNILVNEEKAKSIHTRDTLKIELPSQNIIGHLEMKEGAYGIITGGKNVGAHGKISSIKKAQYKVDAYSLVTVENQAGYKYETNLKNVMVIGEEKPEIRLE
ncbi:30S ribosomal protein S4e [Sulfuracidifex metallicus]|uniref:Small ribosomal subunit protein eS4 n=1 Tax=Sulfuracidifex metallicus DSM 6482 = JCM 9184 TaxID=523847 RepID=A0A6A9QLH3_SULME|nr:30S ribosomal protein S4e [Sulfuracidifex metallicus]MUN28548.1 30S ribosomal protein S4e [Sulfuracidifex metallicus DSM 6482 = JCM 9184]WOE50915.1 30S ribosomal protein S4e [Sulfuracidifex metallicus DSM 6482 = JCM 9184]